MLKSLLRTIINRWLWLKVVRLVIDDLWRGIRLSAGRIDTDSGTHPNLSIDQSVQYIKEVFSDYKTYGAISAFKGTIAEVGPGDNAGVALLMRYDGCRHVDLIDRFFSRRDPQKQIAIYDALSSTFDSSHLRFRPIWTNGALTGITEQIGQPAEEYFRECAKPRGKVYDTIVSRSVMEHLYDPLGALEQMVFCLHVGGRMVHKIDLRDHGMFTPIHHELSFLRIANVVYKYMTQNSGKPNRIMFHRYRDTLDRLKRKALIDYAIFVTRLIGIGEVTPHVLYEQIDAETWHHAAIDVNRYRRYLAREFSQVDSRDLAVSGIFMVVIRR